MRNSILVVSLALVLLIACAPAQQPPAPQPAQPPAEPAAPQPAPAAQPAEAPGPEPVKPAAQVPPSVSQELQALLSIADQKLKSYKYLELIIPDKEQPDTIWIKGTKIKIKLYEYDPYVADTYFDTVYLDTTTKSIVGTCESNKRCIWPQGDNTKKRWTDLNYDQYRRKTPYEMLKQIPATATITGPEVHENRATTKVEYDEAGKHFIYWIDDTYGIPVEVRIMTSDEARTTYKFNDLQFNTVIDADVTAPR